MSDEEEEWECKTCTLLNPPRYLQCDGCTLERPTATHTNLPQAGGAHDDDHHSSDDDLPAADDDEDSDVDMPTARRGCPILDEDEEYDPDLKRVLEESKRDAIGTRSVLRLPAAAVPPGDDDDDAQMRKAMQLSIQSFSEESMARSASQSGLAAIDHDAEEEEEEDMRKNLQLIRQQSIQEELGGESSGSGSGTGAGGSGSRSRSASASGSGSGRGSASGSGSGNNDGSGNEVGNGSGFGKGTGNGKGVEVGSSLQKDGHAVDDCPGEQQNNSTAEHPPSDTNAELPHLTSETATIPAISPPALDTSTAASPSPSSTPIITNPPTRAEMEKERLARLEATKKRERPDDAAAQPEQNRSSSPNPAKKLKSGHASTPLNGTSVSTGFEVVDLTAGMMEPEYPHGKVSQTYMQGWSRAGYVRFEDIVKKTHLQKALFSAFQIDDDWLFSKLPSGIREGRSNVKICIARMKPDVLPVGTMSHFDSMVPGVMHVFPPMGSGTFGCMHSKIMLLWYPGFLRVVVTSANLMDYDWELLENVVFYQDFPPAPPTKPSGETLGPFGDDLLALLEKMKVPPSVRNRVGEFNFGLARARLVCSIPGTYKGGEAFQYGHLALGRVVKPIVECSGFDGDVEGALLYYQTSSLGSLTPKWMTEFHRSACGLGPSEAVKSSRSTSKLKPNGASSNLVKTNTGEVEGVPKFRVLFPSERHVRASRLGVDGAGTISFGRRYWMGEKFPRGVMRELVLGRERGLAHSKVMFWLPTPSDDVATGVLGGLAGGGRRSSVGVGGGGKGVVSGRGVLRVGSFDSQDTDGEDEGGKGKGKVVAGKGKVGEEGEGEGEGKVVGWFYCGSHNCTQSAWGTLSRSASGKGKEKEWTLRMANWEVGVVLPVYEGCGGDVVVPFQVPVRRYESGDVPWSVGVGFGKGPDLTP
ncbi:hypothetical protein HDV00_004889 [Rhizophlyctis rosea]|nr:hypothetical protein HDV00_004889 [Rhizophlyctis rosea]